MFNAVNPVHLLWNPHWIRVAEEDEAMKIGPWVARKRKAFWKARFAVAVANCNAGRGGGQTLFFLFQW